MKIRQFVLAFILVPFFMSSFIAPSKTSKPEPFITFVTASGDERTEALTEASFGDWKDKVSSAEFRSGIKVVEVKGMMIFSPKEGDAIVMEFENKEGFTRIIQKLQTEYGITTGDRIILDNLILIETKKSFSPIVYTAK